MYACIFNLSWLGSSGLTEGSYKNLQLNNWLLWNDYE